MAYGFYKLVIFVFYFSLIRFATAGGIKITFDPPELEIKARQTVPVQFNVTVDSDGFPLDESVFGKLEITSEDPSIAKILNGSIDLNWQNVIREPQTFQFSVSGVFLGRTVLKIRGWKLPDYQHGVVAEYKVAVLRMDVMATLSIVFTAVMFVLIVINTFVMGLQLDWRIILNVFKKPVAPVIGFGCQYIIMPLVATAWAFALLQGVPFLQFGYFAVGCAPGGGASNFWTLLLDGNLDLSVTMTFCSNIAALAMMPFWLYTLGQVFFAQSGGERLSIPFANIIVSLLLLIGPVFLGIVVKHYRPRFAERSKKFVKITTVFIIAVAVVFGGISNAYVFFLITWKTLLCGLLLPWAGFALSYGIAFLIRQDHRNCRTIAIETGIQNAGIAIVLLQTSLKPPESDIAMVMPVCVLIFTPIPLVVALIVKTVLNCSRVRKEKAALADDAVKYDGDVVILDENREDEKMKEKDVRYLKEAVGNGEEAEPIASKNDLFWTDDLRSRKPTEV